MMMTTKKKATKRRSRTMSEPLDIERLGVFQVFTGGGTGSGFLVAENLLVTNCHVVEPFRKVAVELRDKRRVVGKVRRIHPRRDLAIVELDQGIGHEVLEVASSDGLRAKDGVNIVGFPVGLPLSLTEGVISNPSQVLDEMSYVQTDAAINPGNSGGPILNHQKQVIAVTTCKLTEADAVGFGIPGSDVRAFIESFTGQSAEFGVTCPSCDALLESANRYCDGCGSDLESLELANYFEDSDEHPVVAFVEGALRKSNIDPILARHGSLNWSFYSGSAPIQIWSCCSEHLCFASDLAQPGKQKLRELFGYLLSAEHAPLAFDLNDNVIRLNLVLHASDVFSDKNADALVERIGSFIATADRADNLLVEQYGCSPAPKTQLTFLKEGSK
jgi:serine protease Do